MSISTSFVDRFRAAGTSRRWFSPGRGPLHRLGARHRLTDEERRNLADSHRRSRVAPVGIIIASLGGHSTPVGR